MKQFLVLFVLSFFLIVSKTSAQYGINASYQTFSASNWEGLIQASSLDGAAPIASGFAVGIDRWFRLKNARVEFFPELNYARYSVDWDDNKTSLAHQQISLFGNTRFYLFDLTGDCDCPTFSKDGNFLKKGFYVELSPGISYGISSFKGINNDPSSSSIIPSVGLGVGVDIGLSDLITITPMIRFRQHFSAEWENLIENLDIESSPVDLSAQKSGLETFSFGIRFGLRLGE